MCRCRKKKGKTINQPDAGNRRNRLLIILLTVVCLVLTALLVVLVINRINTYHVYQPVVEKTTKTGTGQDGGTSTTVGKDPVHKGTPTYDTDVSSPKNAGSKGGMNASGKGVSSSTNGGNKTTGKKVSSSNGDIIRPGNSGTKTSRDGTQSGNNYHIVISNNTKLYIAIGVFVVLLVSYIVAKVRSKSEIFKLTANKYDKWLILLSPVLFFVVWCIDGGFESKLSNAQIILLSLSALALLASLYFSISSNTGFFNITLSILAKVFIFVGTLLLLLLLIVLFFITLFRIITDHSDRETGTFVMEYDEYLNRWVGYRID